MLTVPFPWGAVTGAGILKLEIFAFGIAALSMFTPGGTLGGASRPFWLLMLVALLGVVQLVPSSPGALASLSPLASTVYREAAELTALFHLPPVTPRISIAPIETESAILLVLAYGAIFVATVRLVRTRNQRRAIVMALIATSIVHVLWASTRLWSNAPFRASEPYADRLHGAFVNANHFAAYLEIALTASFAVLWSEVLRERPHRLDSDRASRFERKVTAIAWPALVFSILFAGIALTKSRMGITAAVVVSLALFVSALLHRRVRHRRRQLTVAAVLLLAATVSTALLTTRDVAFVRFLASDPRDPAFDIRPRLWSASLAAWRSAPNFGAGMGAFRDSFRRVQPTEIAGLAEQAHCDYLQMLVTGGWIGLAICASALAWIFVLLLRGWWRQPHREESAVTLASAGALLALAIHGIAEFNFSIPAIPATLAVVLGVGWSAASDDQPLGRTAA